MRWLNRDPVEEEGGVNLYTMCENSPCDSFDEWGLWAATKESAGKSRRVYQVERGDTIESLAEKIGLDKTEFSKWAKKEKGKIADKKTAVKISGLPDVGCYVSVPNVWISADLMHGGGWIKDRLTRNLGGSIGRGVGTGLFTSKDYMILKPNDVRAMLLSICDNAGDIWGIVVFAHGDKNGIISEPQESKWTEKQYVENHINKWVEQERMINYLKRGKYKIARAYLMQCYSGYGKYESLWETTACRCTVYAGKNFCGLDLGSKLFPWNWAWGRLWNWSGPESVK